MKNKTHSLYYDVEFKIDDSGLHISMKTERLIIHTIETKEDEKYFTEILKDPDVMGKYESGLPYGDDEINGFLEICRNCSKKHDPYHAYVILKQDSKEFIGFIVIWHSAPGESELAYAIHQKFQRKGYVTEAINAVLHSLIPKLMLRGFKLEHKFLKKMVAVVLFNNLPSKKVLLRSGFKEEDKEIYKYGKYYNIFSLYTKSLKNEYQNFFTRKDFRESQETYNQIINENVDTTAEEMANSSFGPLYWTKISR